MGLLVAVSNHPTLSRLVEASLYNGCNSSPSTDQLLLGYDLFAQNPRIFPSILDVIMFYTTILVMTVLMDNVGIKQL